MRVFAARPSKYSLLFSSDISTPALVLDLSISIITIAATSCESISARICKLRNRPKLSVFPAGIKPYRSCRQLS